MTDTDMAEVLLFLQALIRLDSCNPPGYEEPVARVIAQQARQLGLETTVIPLAKGRANVISVLRSSGHLPGLLYVGHLDTVPPSNES